MRLYVEKSTASNKLKIDYVLPFAEDVCVSTIVSISLIVTCRVAEIVANEQQYVNVLKPYDDQIFVPS